MTYLTFQDIAKELQVSVRTVSRMVAEGFQLSMCMDGSIACIGMRLNSF